MRSPPSPAEVVDVTGAGDAMLAAFCHALLSGARPGRRRGVRPRRRRAHRRQPAHRPPRPHRPARRGAYLTETPMTHPTADRSPTRSPTALRRRRARSSRWRARSSATACPTRRTSRWRSRSRGSSATAARCRRRSPCSTAARGSASTPDDLELLASHPRRRQGQRPRPAVRRRPRHATARPPWPPRCGWPRWPASASSSPAGSAACTAARQQTFDISADLTELGDHRRRRGVAPGVKSILDIGLTLETLETLGVPVLALRHRRVPVVLLPLQRARGADARRHRPPRWPP